MYFLEKKYRKNCRISKGNIVKGDDDAATVFCYFLWFFFQLTIKTKVKKKWNSKQTKNVKNEQFEEEQEKKYIKIGNNDLENEREFYKRKKSS